MVKIIGLRNLNRTEIQEVVFENEGIQVDTSITNDFPQESKDPAIDLTQIQIIIESLSEKLSPLVKSLVVENNGAFSRGFLFALSLQLTKQRKQIRKQTIDFVISAFNAFAKPTSLAENPFSILSVFYGEGGVAEVLENASIKPVSLTKQEVTIITGSTQTSFTSALTLLNLFNTKNALKLSQLGFSLFCESGYINTELFLPSLLEKRSLQRSISLLASELQNLLSSSRLSKKKPSADTISWVEITGSTRSGYQQLLDYVVDELAVETEEGQKGAEDKEARAYAGLNGLLLSLLGSIHLQTLNTVGRLQVKEDLGAQINEKIQTILESAKGQGSLLSYQNIIAVPNEQFGSNLVLLLKFQNLIDNLLKIVQVECTFSLQVLDKLNKSLSANKKEKKVEKEGGKPDNKKPKKEVKLLQLGKGTDVIFLEVIGEHDFQNDETATNVCEAYFSFGNKDLLFQIEELIAPRNEERRKPKIPKGTRDFTPLQMAIKRRAFKIIQNILLQHGAVEIDTPVFELKETLTGKYGNDSKLIYDLDDQGGELLSLRYDLTVPFARYLSSQSLTNFKRFHIAKVYRRDQPNMTKGRYREFYQCDIDIAGNYDPMIPDAEIIKIVNDILEALKLGSPFTIKVNSRRILDAMVEIAGAPSKKFKTICSSIDKLDKEPWSEVKRELIEDKGLTEAVVNKLGEFVTYKGNPIETLEKIKSAKLFDASESGRKGVQEMGLLFEYLAAMDCLSNISFDLSLARGLDYYTGMIYEAVLEGASIGSIGGGGRYDGLVGMFSSQQIPSVGGSVGIERVFNILEDQFKKKLGIRSTETEFLVCTIGAGLCKEKLKLVNEMWKADFKAEIIYAEKPKPNKQLEYALENQIPFMIWLGEEEMKGGFVKIKCTYLKTEEIVQRSELFTVLEQKVAQYYDDIANDRVVYTPEKAPSAE